MVPYFEEMYTAGKHAFKKLFPFLIKNIILLYMPRHLRQYISLIPLNYFSNKLVMFD